MHTLGAVVAASMRNKRVSLPVVAVLLAFLAGAGYVVYRQASEPLRDSGVIADELDPDRIPDVDGRGEDGWRHHDWTPGEGAEEPPGPTPTRDGMIPPGEVDDENYDPQMWAMRRSFHHSDGEDAGVPLPFSPTQRAAQIVSATGGLSISRDATCNVRVLPVQTGQFNCLVRVVCDGRVLYPNPSQTAGYAPCELENGSPVSAVDDGHSALDGDPRIHLDLREGTITVEDEGDGVTPFTATLRVH